MNPLSFFHLLNVGGIQKTIEIYVFNSFFISIVLFLLHVYVGSGIYMYIYTDQRKRKKYILLLYDSKSVASLRLQVQI